MFVLAPPPPPYSSLPLAKNEVRILFFRNHIEDELENKKNSFFLF